MVEEFKIDLQRLHNDSTSITFSGEYREKPPRADRRRRLKIVLAPTMQNWPSSTGQRLPMGHRF